MAISIDSRIWLATHLLYPNSSQAFDVYQSLMTQSEDSIRKKNINFIFLKLYQIVEKIQAVSSNKAFHVFETDQIKQWQQIYKKSQKEQLIIFVGYFVFDLKLKEIASVLKLNIERAHFLFHQTFKKTIFTNIKLDVQDKISFKKVNEEKVSYLFTNENLIDYCLNNLTAQEMKKVNIGLEIYPELQASQKQYESIVKQMRYLVDFQQERVTKPLIQISEPLSTPRENFEIGILFSKNRKLISSIAVSLTFIFLVMLRPKWIKHASEQSKDRSVVLQEVTPKQNTPAEDFLPAPTQVKVAETTLTVEKLKIASSVKSAVLAKGNSEKVIETKTEPMAVATTKSTVVVHSAPQDIANQPKKSGGLYRGVLTVTDIAEVTPKITERLVDIGGRKAGDVELGWRKSETLSYYHFTLPENNIDTMKEFLGKFGSLEIQFENHPRLMPAGVKRLIIEVKERE